MRLTKLSSLAVVLLAPLSANALLITPQTDVCGDPTCLLATGPETSQNTIDAILSGMGITDLIYKQNVGQSSDTGEAAGSYMTTFANSPTDPSEATITYVANQPVFAASHLLVKDGNNNPAWYLFALDWDGMETISLRNFWPERGAISHVSLYGRISEVPEPETLGLLGMSLIALGLIRRRRTRPDSARN